MSVRDETEWIGPSRYAVLVQSSFPTPPELAERFPVLRYELVERYAPRVASLLLIAHGGACVEMERIVAETIPASARFVP